MCFGLSRRIQNTANTDKRLPGPHSAGVFIITSTLFQFRLSIPEPKEPIRIAARTRYHQAEHPETVYPLSQSKVRIDFDEPQRAVTPGQASVLYDGELVLGGGTIEEEKQFEPGY